MDFKLGEILGIGLGLVFGILMLMIAMGFLPGIFDATSEVLSHANITDFTGAEESVAALPTFTSLGVMVVGLFLILGPIGVVGYRVFQSGKN